MKIEVLGAGCLKCSKAHYLKAGEIIIMPVHKPHALKA